MGLLNLDMNRGFRKTKHGDLAFYPNGYRFNGYIVDETTAKKIIYYHKTSFLIQISVIILSMIILFSFWRLGLYISAFTVIFSHSFHFIIYYLKIRPLLIQCRVCEERLTYLEIVRSGAIKLKPWIWFFMILLLIYIFIFMFHVMKLSKLDHGAIFAILIFGYALYSLITRFIFSHIYHQRLLRKKIEPEANS
jgi:hypothetical protein